MITVDKFLAKKLNYEFKSQALVQEALTHRSVSSHNNERLEFLGDGALNFVIASEIYRRKPDYQEGQLSRLRANLVRGVTLSEIAREIGLGDYIKLGTGELKSGGFDRDSILADAVEALLGAVYLDGGFDQVQRVVCFLYKDRLENLPADEPLKDAKTRLQEYLQARKLPIPEYVLLETRGEAHKREFVVSARVDTLKLETKATGSSRRRAEQAAATIALRKLETESH